MTQPAGVDDYIGRTVASKFRIDSLIGEGGMGRVYKAHHQQLDKPVVLKILRHSLLSDERTVARFQREARAASRLNHPNSISILDYGKTDDGAHFIAMEFVAGRDLHYILSKEWPLPESRIANLMAQVLSALADAHSAGVIHRDLKPENIMVEVRRGAELVKVLDFGIAKITDASGDDGPALTRAGFVCGTPEYMSPEQARGAVLDSRSDLYAVGVILYQLATGVLPFEADSAVGFATKHLTATPPPPSKRRPNLRVSPGLEKLILRTMAKDPNDRPQTAEAFREELLAAVPVPSQQTSSTPESGTLAPHRPSPPMQMPPRVAPIPPPARAPLPPPVPTPDSASSLSGARTDVGLSARDTVLTPRKGGAGELVMTEGAYTVSRSWPRYVAAIALVVGVVAIVAVLLHPPTPDDVYWPPPPNAPLQKSAATQAPPAEPDLSEKQVSPADVDPLAAERLQREGDAAVRAGDWTKAISLYRDAFEKQPSPTLSLKLGELYFKRKETEQARKWWRRHLKDSKNSPALGYIQRVMPDVL